jgi:hypothetical protein
LRTGRQKGAPKDRMLRAYVAYHRAMGRTIAWIARTLDRAASGIGRIVNSLEEAGEIPDLAWEGKPCASRSGISPKGAGG